MLNVFLGHNFKYLSFSSRRFVAVSTAQLFIPHKYSKPNKIQVSIRNISTINEMKIEEISIQVPWGQIRGQIFRNASLATAQPIICLHGYLDNSNSFKPLAYHLTRSNEYYMIALDFPGHGLSSKIPDGIPYTPKLFVSSVRRAVRYFKLKKFYFMGHSYGIGTSLFVR